MWTITEPKAQKRNSKLFRREWCSSSGNSRLGYRNCIFCGCFYFCFSNYSFKTKNITATGTRDS